MAGNRGFLNVVSNSELEAAEQEDIERKRGLREEEEREFRAPDLINYIRQQFEIMRDHRASSGLDMRLIRSLQVFNGQYDANKLAEIRKFGGSEVYSRVVGTKSRGATALLRDIYFQAERPWTIEPTPQPTIPNDVRETIPRLVQMEVMSLAQQGQPIDQTMIQDRMRQLMEAADNAARQRARDDAERSVLQLDDFLHEGGFYKALAELLVDLPLFPFVCLKGPMVRILPKVKWENGKAIMKEVPRMVWQRVSPFDVFFTPGVSSIREADICERLRWTRKDLNDLIGLPGWDEDAVRDALEDYDGGLRDWMTQLDSQRAMEEGREDPTFNRSSMIDALEFHGTVQGEILLQLGWGEDKIPDPQRDYAIEAWIVGRHVLKVQLSPSPRKRHPYFITSFEKVPGTPVGNALPDMLADIEDIANASLRALANNMAMASGPQVVVDTQRVSPEEDVNNMYPWKIWHVEDELGSNASNPPVRFDQPQSNASELLGIYTQMTQMADEISAIPRYITGSGATGGAGRTASGLSMLMGNASKMLQQVASNVDIDIIGDTVEQLYDLIMVTGVGGVPLRGDESIVVRGAATVVAREAERARQLEFLGLTANPIDMQITGIEGRAAVLREISKGLGLPGSDVVPTREQFQERQRQTLAAQKANAEVGAQGDGNAPGKPADSTAPIENTVQPGFNTGGMNG